MRLDNTDALHHQINSGKVIIIDFWATWCGPCKVISPVFETLATANKGNANVGFYKVDVDDVPDVAEEVGIRAVCLFPFKKFCT